MVKDPLSLLWLESLLWHGFDPWPRNFCMPWVQYKKKKERKEERKKRKGFLRLSEADVPTH